jgi:hypothetical protein
VSWRPCKSATGGCTLQRSRISKSTTHGHSSRRLSCTTRRRCSNRPHRWRRLWGLEFAARLGARPHTVTPLRIDHCWWLSRMGPSSFTRCKVMGRRISENQHGKFFGQHFYLYQPENNLARHTAGPLNAARRSWACERPKCAHGGSMPVARGCNAGCQCAKQPPSRCASAPGGAATVRRVCPAAPPGAGACLASLSPSPPSLVAGVIRPGQVRYVSRPKPGAMGVSRSSRLLADP